MTKTFETCLAEIKALAAVASEQGDAYVGVPLIELQVILAEAEVTVSEAASVLARAPDKAVEPVKAVEPAPKAPARKPVGEKK